MIPAGSPAVIPTSGVQRRRETVIEDVRFLRDQHEWPDRIARRLGYRDRMTLQRMLQRWGERDLAEYFAAPAWP